MTIKLTRPARCLDAVSQAAGRFNPYKLDRSDHIDTGFLIMKTVQWVLIACRLLAVSFGLTLVHSGCGDQSAPSGVSTEEEKKRDAETRKAMEAASKASMPTHKKK